WVLTANSRYPLPVLGAIPVVRPGIDHLLRALNSQPLRPRIHLDRTRDPSTGFDLDLSVRDRAGNMTTSADQQPLVDDEITLNAATHVGIFRRTVASECAG